MQINERIWRGFYDPHKLRWDIAYNAGAGHVRDARKIATRLGLDPNVWFDNVEIAMLEKMKADVYPSTRFGYCNGEEPVRYVRAISDRYDAYVQIIENNVPAEKITTRLLD